MLIHIETLTSAQIRTKLEDLSNRPRQEAIFFRTTSEQQLLKQIHNLSYVPNSGVVGVVGHILTVENEEHSKILGHLAARKMQCILTVDRDAKLRLLRENPQWKLFPMLALDELQEPKALRNVTSVNGCLGYAHQLVSIPEKSRNISESCWRVIFNDCLVFDNYANAEVYFNRLPKNARPSIICLDKALLHSNGIQEPNILLNDYRFGEGNENATLRILRKLLELTEALERAQSEYSSGEQSWRSTEKECKEKIDELEAKLKILCPNDYSRKRSSGSD